MIRASSSGFDADRTPAPLGTSLRASANDLGRATCRGRFLFAALWWDSRQKPLRRSESAPAPRVYVRRGKAIGIDQRPAGDGGVPKAVGGAVRAVGQQKQTTAGYSLRLSHARLLVGGEGGGGLGGGLEIGSARRAGQEASL